MRALMKYPYPVFPFFDDTGEVESNQLIGIDQAGGARVHVELSKESTGDTQLPASSAAQRTRPKRSPKPTVVALKSPMSSSV